MRIAVSKKVIVVVAVAALSILAVVLFGKAAPVATATSNTAAQEADGIITVKGGYSPKVVTLPAGRETILRFVTKNTYDCSASLVIPKFKIEQFFPPNGYTDVKLPAQPAGTEVVAGCSMGMYSFLIKFQ